MAAFRVGSRPFCPHTAAAATPCKALGSVSASGCAQPLRNSTVSARPLLHFSNTAALQQNIPVPEEASIVGVEMPPTACTSIAYLSAAGLISITLVKLVRRQPPASLSDYTLSPHGEQNACITGIRTRCVSSGVQLLIFRMGT